MRGGAVRPIAAVLGAGVIALLAASCAGGADASDERAGTTARSPSSTTLASPTTTTAPPPTTSTTVVDESTILLAWTSGGLPPGFSEVATGRPEVQRATVVLGGQADLVSSARSDGSAVDQAASGWAYPQDTLAVDPTSYGSFTNDPADRSLLKGLVAGDALLTESSAELRGLDVGSTMELRGGSLTVAGVISDRSGGEAELIVHRDDAARLGVDTERFVLMMHDPGQRAALDAAWRTPPTARSSTCGRSTSLRGCATATAWCRSST